MAIAFMIGRRTTMRKDKGFTLMELMVTIAIIAIIAVTAMPSVIGVFPRIRLSTGARDLHDAVQLAKIRAVKQNVSTVLAISVANGSYALFVDNGAGVGIAEDGIRNGTEATILQGQLPTDVRITGTTFGGNTVNFNARGFPAGPGTVSIASTAANGGQRTINVTTAGGINITDP